MFVINIQVEAMKKIIQLSNSLRGFKMANFTLELRSLTEKLCYSLFDGFSQQTGYLKATHHCFSWSCMVAASRLPLPTAQLQTWSRREAKLGTIVPAYIHTQGQLRVNKVTKQACFFSTMGGSWNTHSCSGRTYNSTRKDLRLGYPPRTVFLQGNSTTNLTTGQPTEKQKRLHLNKLFCLQGYWYVATSQHCEV